MDKITFELRSEYAGPGAFDGGSVTLGGGEQYDVKAALKKGAGEIATADPALIAVLDAYPPLKRATSAKRTKKTTTENGGER